MGCAVPAMCRVAQSASSLRGIWSWLPWAEVEVGRRMKQAERVVRAIKGGIMVVRTCGLYGCFDVEL